MVDFFICWTDSDPFYQDYFEDCNVSISLPHVPQSWNISRFPTQPAQIMVDSGAFYSIINPRWQPSQAQVFAQQLSITRGSAVPTILCHLDVPLPPTDLSTVEVYRRLEKTVANAYEFIRLFRAAGLPPNFKALGVIQGNCHDTISFCANELARAGFDRLGLGSLATLYRKDLIMERVMAAARVAGPDLHIFGISGIETAAELMALGVRSLDSSRPMRVAMYNCLLYSRPFRKYRIKNSRVRESIPALDNPLPCPCPICKKDPALIFRAGEKRYHNLRAVHNYYHLMVELEAVACGCR